MILNIILTIVVFLFFCYLVTIFNYISEIRQAVFILFASEKNRLMAHKEDLERVEKMLKKEEQKTNGVPWYLEALRQGANMVEKGDENNENRPNASGNIESVSGSGMADKMHENADKSSSSGV